MANVEKLVGEFNSDIKTIKWVTSDDIFTTYKAFFYIRFYGILMKIP